MNRFLWVMAAAFLVVGSASAEVVVVPHYFTWYNVDEVEKGPLYVDSSVHLVVPDYGAYLPEGYHVSNWWRSSTPGACDVAIPTYDTYQAWFYPSAAGDYEICLELTSDTVLPPTILDIQTLTVLNAAPWIKSIQLYPNPAVVGSPLEAQAQVSDNDGVDSCAFDFGEAEAPVWEPGVLTPPEWDPGSTTQLICTATPHVYTVAGPYAITIQATDDLGAVRTSTPELIDVLPRPYILVDKIDIQSTLARSRRLYDYTGTVSLFGVGSTASLAKAQVTAEWRDGRTGAVLFRQSAVANASGVAKFVMRSVALFQYNLCVTNVKKSGFDYYADPEYPPCAYGGGPE